ncbi:hypothetical protein [Gordonia jinhuaensis]|uniref:hypothetical protein n=1 Tax=Gordonia jinhuaensis TaxID=1517702 RepID=UPI001664EFA4|nr:hypothetical protein [Gordonia jinhuaensis]
MQNPPAMLRRLVARGLEIRHCPDYGPHKKYYPYCEQFAGDDHVLVTADDDVIYPRWWLRRLDDSYRDEMVGIGKQSAARRDPVVCHRAHVVRHEDSGIAPYVTWKECRTTRASLDNFATGTSGVLYGPAAQRAIRDAGDAWKILCPRADDVWLHFAVTAVGIPIRQTRSVPWTAPSRVETWGAGLAWGNVLGGENDEAIAATAAHFGHAGTAAVSQ